MFFCFSSFFGVFFLLSVFWVVVSALNVLRDLEYVSVLYQLFFAATTAYMQQLIN